MTSAPLHRDRRTLRRRGSGTGVVVALMAGILAHAGLGLGAVWIATHEQRISDQFAVWRYEPDAAVAGYAERAGLTDEGRFLFYASAPAIKDGDAFADVCGSSFENFGVLGCYEPSEGTITLFDVTDDRLNGLEEVVAAHELLHAVWDRMSSAERDALVPLLDAEAAAHADDPAFAGTLAFYADIEPGQRHNELHSIVGTEFGSVSPELEEHYARYLADRGAVVALHERSNAVFVEFQAQADSLAGQLEALGATIAAEYAGYTTGIAALKSDVDDFNVRAGNGSFSSQSQFDAERNGLIARGDALDAQYAAIQARVEEHDALLAELDGINADIDALNQAINIEPPDVPELQTG